MGASRKLTAQILRDNYCCDCGCGLMGDFYDTVYGHRYCDMCYDEYLFSDMGKLEYLASLVRGEMSPSSLDAETLGEIAVAWKHYHHLLEVTPEELAAFKAKMQELNLL